MYLLPINIIGVETPGILVAKKRLFAGKQTSSQSGGGTVFFVVRRSISYLYLYLYFVLLERFLILIILIIYITSILLDPFRASLCKRSGKQRRRRNPIYCWKYSGRLSISTQGKQIDIQLCIHWQYEISIDEYLYSSNAVDILYSFYLLCNRITSERS